MMHWISVTAVIMTWEAPHRNWSGSVWRKLLSHINACYSLFNRISKLYPGSNRWATGRNHINRTPKCKISNTQLQNIDISIIRTACNIWIWINEWYFSLKNTTRIDHSSKCSTLEITIKGYVWRLYSVCSLQLYFEKSAYRRVILDKICQQFRNGLIKRKA